MSEQPFQSELHSAYDEELPPGFEEPETALSQSMQGIQYDQQIYNNEGLSDDEFNQQFSDIDPSLLQHQPNQLTSHSTASSIYPPLTTSGATTTAATPYFTNTSATDLSDLLLSEQLSDVELRPDASIESERASKRVMSQGDYDARHAQDANWSSSSQNVYQQAAPVAPMFSNVSQSSQQVTRENSDVTSSHIPPTNQLALPQTHQRRDLTSQLSGATNNNPFDMSNNPAPYQAGVGQAYQPSFSQQVRGSQHASQQLNPTAPSFNAHIARQSQNSSRAGPSHQAPSPEFFSGHTAFQAVARLAGSAFNLPSEQTPARPFVDGLLKPWEGIHVDPELPAHRDNSMSPPPPARPGDDGRLLCGNLDCKKILARNSQESLCPSCITKRKHEQRGPTMVPFDETMTYAQAVDNVFSFRERHSRPQGSAEMLADFEFHAREEIRQLWARAILDAMNQEYRLPGPGFADTASELIGKARVKAQAGYDLKFVQQTEQYNYRMINSRVLMLLEAAIQYQAGNPRTVYDDGGDNMGYSTETKLMLSERLKLICDILRDEKKIVLDIIEGRGVNAFVRDPNRYLQRKVDNIKSNDRKRQAKEEADGGPPKSGGSRKTQNARSQQAIRRQQEEAQRAGMDPVKIPKPPGRKRRGRSTSRSVQQQQSQELMRSPGFSDTSMMDFGTTSRINTQATSFDPYPGQYAGYQVGGHGQLGYSEPLQPQADYSMSMGMPPMPPTAVAPMVPPAPNALPQANMQRQASNWTREDWQRHNEAIRQQMLLQQRNAELAQQARINAQSAIQYGPQSANMAQNASSQQTGQRPNVGGWRGFQAVANNQYTQHPVEQQPDE